MKINDLQKSLDLLDAIISLKDVVPNKAYVRRSLFKVMKLTNGKFSKLAKAIKAAIKKVEVPENEAKFYEFLMKVFNSNM